MLIRANYFCSSKNKTYYAIPNRFANRNSQGKPVTPVWESLSRLWAEFFYFPSSSRNTEQAFNPSCFAGVECLLMIVRGNRWQATQSVFCQNGRVQIFQNLGYSLISSARAESRSSRFSLFESSHSHTTIMCQPISSNCCFSALSRLTFFSNLSA